LGLEVARRAKISAIADKERGLSLTDASVVEMINVLVVITGTDSVWTTHTSWIVVHVGFPEKSYWQTRTVTFEGVFAANDCHGAM
jgi:hypothetical protein